MDPANSSQTEAGKTEAGKTEASMAADGDPDNDPNDDSDGGVRT